MMGDPDTRTASPSSGLPDSPYSILRPPERRPTHSVPCVIGVGANLGNPGQQVADALVALAHLPESRLLRTSHRFHNPPMGPSSQPDYVNAVALLETELAPSELLAALQAIEGRAGRSRDGERWGPRILDLDLLFYGDWAVSSRDLTIPHPGVSERAFVVVPLAEIAPQWMMPGGANAIMLPAGQLAARFADARLQRLPDIGSTSSEAGDPHAADRVDTQERRANA